MNDAAIAYRHAETTLGITPVTGRIGAVVEGVNLKDDLSPEVIAALRAAMVRHKVIFVRDQHLDDESHEAFASRFGKPLVHPTLPVLQGYHHLLDLDSKEGVSVSMWHTDMTYLAAYAEASILRPIILPEAGGDTLWTNTATAYEAMPQALQDLADNLWTVHDNGFDYAALRLDSSKENARQAQVPANTYAAEHPLVRVHPESGERTMILGHFFKRMVGLSTADSQRLFELFQDHITKPENFVRWRWRMGDVAIWDNRSTQHRAISDFGTQRRSVRRATMAGDVPVSVNGVPSRQISPTP